MYKVGDKVVLVKDRPVACCYVVGDVLIIVRCEDAFVEIRGHQKKLSSQTVHQSQLILEEIYNSPLYKALKED